MNHCYCVMIEGEYTDEEWAAGRTALDVRKGEAMKEVTFYRPIECRICCKAHADCRERASYRVQIRRGRRHEDRPYCEAHLGKLRERLGDSLRLGHLPTAGTGGHRRRLDG